MGIGVSDAVRPEAAHIIRSLHSRGIACYMVTGDETCTALVSFSIYTEVYELIHWYIDLL